MQLRTCILTLALIMMWMNAALAGPPTLAIVDFTAEDGLDWPTLAPKLGQMLEQRVVNSGLFTVVERAKLKAVMQEHGWQQVGFVSPESAVSVGKQLGAQYLMTGSVVDANREVRGYNAYGAQGSMSTLRVTAIVKVVDLEKNTIVAAFEEEANASIQEGGGVEVEHPKAFTDVARHLADRLMLDLAAAPFLASVSPNARENMQIMIYSEPAGADVVIDGVYFGNTGRQIWLAPGVHDVAISLAGHETWRKKVAVTNGMSFTARLNRGPTPVE